MSVVKLVRHNDELLVEIASNMREADRIEVKASSGLTPYESLKYSCDKSNFTVVVMVDDMPIAVFGLSVINALTGLGTPWLLSSEEAMNHKREFFKLSPSIIQEMLSICPKLYNYVHAENKVSIKWLKWLGFTVESDPVEYGVKGEKFHKFYMNKV